MSLVPTSFGDNAFQPGVRAEVYIPDQLIAGQLQLVTDTVTITGAAAYVRGTVLGVITASGKYTEALAASNDGSQVPAAILVDDIDVTGGDALGGIYKMGEFNGNALTLGAGITLAAAKAALGTHGIFIKTAVSAADPT